MTGIKFLSGYVLTHLLLFFFPILFPSQAFKPTSIYGKMVRRRFATNARSLNRKNVVITIIVLNSLGKPQLERLAVLK
ncbi:hypothetical protein DESC_790024 [Desulfosarcina cetonica]|nr:hypothetical protein DESC_790024 [Desulfosarcina cetonica]